MLEAYEKIWRDFVDTPHENYLNNMDGAKEREKPQLKLKH